MKIYVEIHNACLIISLQIAEMFPNIDKEVIKSVYDAQGGQRATTINALLQMSE